MKSTTPDTPPSAFAKAGPPHASTAWWKTEKEILAWAYVSALARDGDTWHRLSPERCEELLNKEELVKAGRALQLVILREVPGWWADVTRHLGDADSARSVSPEWSKVGLS